MRLLDVISRRRDITHRCSPYAAINLHAIDLCLDTPKTQLDSTKLRERFVQTLSYASDELARSTHYLASSENFFNRFEWNFPSEI
jgi:hypothetical protein